jgi:hypothetical protein
MKKVLIALILAITAGAVFGAGVPNLITYQGKLTGTDGQPVTDGTYSLTLKIYNDSTGGTANWTETNSVNTEKGIFSVRLGYVNVLSPSLFSGPNLFLGISINGGAEISARHRLTSVAYAFQSAYSDTAQFARTAPTGADSDWAVADSNIYRLNGNVGIGISTPETKLHVNGSLRTNSIGIGAGTPWLDNGIYLDAGSQTTPIAWDNRSNCSFWMYEDGAAQKLISRSYGGGSTEEWKWISAGLGDLFTIGPNIIMNRNVGISTTNPAFNLDVNGTTRSVAFNGNWLYLNGDHPNARFIWGQSDYRWEAGADGGFYLYDQNAASYRLYMNPNGNFGVGVAYPPFKLDVSGDIHSSNNLYVDGNLCVIGQKNAIVPTSKGMAKVYCEESAESWFSDYGEARLENGKVHVELDPLFLETITIDVNHPMQVFLQEYGNTEGLVASRGQTGFDVIEKNNGKSNSTFGYRVVAKRKNYEKDRLEISQIDKNNIKGESR